MGITFSECNRYYVKYTRYRRFAVIISRDRREAGC
jgi:hypothetical protein